MSQLNLALFLIGSLTLLSSLFVGLVRSRLYLVSEAMMATLLGALAGQPFSTFSARLFLFSSGCLSRGPTMPALAGASFFSWPVYSSFSAGFLSSSHSTASSSRSAERQTPRSTGGLAIGVAAIFYATMAASKSHHPDVWVISSFVVLSSIIVHGATSTPFMKWYGKETGRADSDESGKR